MYVFFPRIGHGNYQPIFSFFVVNLFLPSQINSFLFHLQRDRWRHLRERLLSSCFLKRAIFLIFYRSLQKNKCKELCTVDNTSMNPSLFSKKDLLIFSGCIWATDKWNTNFWILISWAFRWPNQIFTPTNSTADMI